MKYQKNNLDDIIFPIGFNFRIVDEILHIASNAGREYFESPTMRQVKYISLAMISLGAIIGSCSHHYNGHINIPAIFASIIAGIGIILLLINITNSSIRTNFFVSSRGIKIKSNKGSYFIEKDNIEKIYSRKFTSRNWTHYKIFLMCKNNIYLDVSKQYKKEFSLFCDIDFNSLTTVEFIIDALNTTLEFDDQKENIDSKTNEKINTKNFKSLKKDNLEEEKIKKYKKRKKTSM